MKIFIKLFKYKIFFLTIFVCLLFSEANSDDFKIGASLALSGEGAVWGQNAQKGIELATKEINLRGGIQGKPIKVYYGDFRSSDLKLAVQNVKRFISTDKVDVVLTQWSGDSQVILPITTKHNLITFCIGPANDELGVKYPLFARMWPSDLSLIEPIIDFIIKNNYKKPMVLGTSDPYFVNLSKLTKSIWKEKTNQEIHYKEIDSNSNDLANIALSVKSFNPDVLIIHTPYNIEGTLLNRVRELNINIPIIESQKSDDQSVLAVAGKNAEGLIYPEYSESTKEFKEKFINEYNVKPIVPSEYAYDAVNLIATSYNDTYENSLPKIINIIRTTKDFKGASGVLDIDKNGNRIKQKVNLMIIKNGKAEKLFANYN